jgi:hypothetical protein
MPKNIGDKFLFYHYQRLFNGASANYLLDPNPKTIECSGQKTLRFQISHLILRISIKMEMEIMSDLI